MNIAPGWYNWHSRTPQPRTLALLNSANNLANQASYSYATQPFGTAAANRVIIAAAMATGAAQAVTGVTIGGVTATLLANLTDANGSVCISGAIVPTGTTGTIVVTYAGTQQRSILHVFGGDGFSLTPFQVVTDSSTTNPKAVNVHAVSGGTIIGAITFITGAGSPNISWGGLTLDSTTDVEATNHRMSSAHQSGLAGQVNRAISATADITPTTYLGAFVSLVPLL